MRSNRIFKPGNRHIFIYLTFLSAFAPLATDLYLPALPSMVESFGVSNAVISLTITLFLLIFGTSMLLWGPLGDRYGRKPVVLAGSLLFIVASVAIAISDSVYSLFFWRFLQAVGGSAVSCTSLAVVKDIMRGPKMERILSAMQGAHILAPMIAPVLGAGILLVVNWRGIFWVLAFFGLLAFLGGLGLGETTRTRSQGSPFETFGKYGVVLKNRRFREALLVFSLSAMPFMPFLAVSSFIYQDQFGLSPQAYSFFFALNATFSLLGPFAHLWFFHKLPRGKLILWQFCVMALAGFLLLFLGGINPWLFAGIFILVTFCGSAMRPPSTVLMMECIRGNNGILASLISFGHMLFGSAAMFLAAFSFWPSYTFAVACIAFVISGVCAIWWRKIKDNY